MGGVACEVLWGVDSGASCCGGRAWEPSLFLTPWETSFLLTCVPVLASEIISCSLPLPPPVKNLTLKNTVQSFLVVLFIPCSSLAPLLRPSSFPCFPWASDQAKSFWGWKQEWKQQRANCPVPALLLFSSSPGPTVAHNSQGNSRPWPSDGRTFCFTSDFYQSSLWSTR